MELFLLTGHSTKLICPCVKINSLILIRKKMTYQTFLGFLYLKTPLCAFFKGENPHKSLLNIPNFAPHDESLIFFTPVSIRKFSLMRHNSATYLFGLIKKRPLFRYVCTRWRFFKTSLHLKNNHNIAKKLQLVQK